MEKEKFRLRQDNKIVGYEKWYGGKKATQDDPTSAKAQWLYSKDGEYWSPEYIYHNKKDRCVGLKDKNGKEIYEGDILSGDYPDEVYWYRDRGQWTLANHKNPDDTLWEILRDNNCEIIGNIYENPELLN